MKHLLSVLFLISLSIALLFIYRSPAPSDPLERSCLLWVDQPEAIPSDSIFLECKKQLPEFEKSWLLMQFRKKSPRNIYGIWNSINPKIELNQAIEIYPFIQERYTVLQKYDEDSKVVLAEWLRGLEKAMQEGLSELSENCKQWSVEQCFEALDSTKGLKKDVQDLKLKVLWDRQLYQEIEDQIEMIDESVQKHWKKRLEAISKERSIAEELNLIETMHFKAYVEVESYEFAHERLDALEKSFEAVSQAFHWSPERKIEVVFFVNEKYDGLGVFPTWAEAIYDGKIRIPIKKIQDPERFERTIRHELAHAFLAELSNLEYPRWWQEGLAQWVEGTKVKEPTRKISWEELNEPFQNLSEDKVELAYRWSLFFIENLVERKGAFTLKNFIQKLENTTSFEDTFTVHFGLKPKEFFKY